MRRRADGTHGAGADMSRRQMLGMSLHGGLGAWLVLNGAYPGLEARGTMSPQAVEPLTRAIPGTDERLPVIGMGTWQTFDVGAGAGARAGIKEVLRAFVAQGGRVIDSSPMYGSSETVYGDLAAELDLGNRMFVATKVWTTGRDEGIRQMEESRRRMRVDRVDLMQVHNLVDLATHLRTLRDWKTQGRIRYLGATHYTEGAQDNLMQVMRSEPLDFVQINFSIAEPAAERALLPLAEERGIGVLINRPFGGGSLFRQVRGKPLPTWVSEYGIASWAQLFLKYVVSHPAVTCAIPATSNPAHLIDNMGAARGPLPDARARRRLLEAVTR